MTGNISRRLAAVHKVLRSIGSVLNDHVTQTFKAATREYTDTRRTAILSSS